MSLTELNASFLFLFLYLFMCVLCLYYLLFLFYTLWAEYLFCLFVYDGMIRSFIQHENRVDSN